MFDKCRTLKLLFFMGFLAVTFVSTVSGQTSATTTVDTTKKYQTIEGLGGATAFYAGWITAHPYKQEIYSNAFAGLNLSMLRLGDWFRYPLSWSGFDSAATEIVANGNRILGHPVPVYMSSWSPPASLKNNKQVANGGSLIYTNGGFIYNAFAQYWYDSILAYQSNGVNLTWISIQNEPDWVASYDSCIFKPNEDGTNYASYSKALDAVYQKLSSLPSPPKLLAPEPVHVSYNDLKNYAATMNTKSFYGIAHHLYGDATDANTLGSITNIFPTKPRFMTEFGLSDMMDQAVLLHNTLVFEQASGYNYWSLVWPGTNGGLIQIENPFSSQSSWTNAPAGTPTQSHGWWIAPAYWAMKHYSYFIQPGFRRVSAVDTDNNVLSSAYVSQDGLRLVVVLINTSASVSSSMNFNFGAFSGKSTVYQTAGTNHFRSLGAVASPTSLPPRSLTTVVLDKTVSVGAASNPSPTNGASGVSLNSLLSWTPGNYAVTHAVYCGTSSNAVATATPASPEFKGIVNTNSFSVGSAAAWGTAYYWRVDEIAYSNTNQGSVWSFRTAPAVQLPSPWQSQDIGYSSGQSCAIYDNGVFTVGGSGADIWGGSDAFRFAYVSVTGNCTMIARVAGLQNTDPWAKAGIMIRESLAANAVNSFIAVTPGNGVTWQYRTSTGGNSANNNITGLGAPYWVKLVRSGNTFTGYRSADGVSWTQLGSVTMTMASSAYIGLAVTSHNSSTLCTATFDNVAAPGWQGAGPTGLAAAPVSTTQIKLTWNALAPATSYNVQRSLASGGPYSAVASGVTATNYLDRGLAGGTMYYYVVNAVVVGNPTTNSIQASAATLSPTDGSLVHRYAFADPVGTNVADSVGGPVWTGTLPNGGTLTGSNLTLSSASQQYVGLPVGIVGSLSNFTLMTWVNLASSSAGNRIFDFGNDSTYMFLTPQNADTGSLRFAITTDGSGGEQQINSSSSLSAGVCHQLAVSWDAGIGTLYVDGIAVGTNSGMTLNPASLGSTIRNYIGQSQSPSDPFLDGSIEDFRIYNVGLSAAEIAASAALGPGQLLSTNAPAMSLAMGGTNLTVSWPLPSAGFILQSSTNLLPGSWMSLTSPVPQIFGTQWQVALPPVTNTGSVFYRLIK